MTIQLHKIYLLNVPFNCPGGGGAQVHHDCPAEAIVKGVQGKSKREAEAYLKSEP